MSIFLVLLVAPTPNVPNLSRCVLKPSFELLKLFYARNQVRVPYDMDSKNSSWERFPPSVRKMHGIMESLNSKFTVINLYKQLSCNCKYIHQRSEQIIRKNLVKIWYTLNSLKHVIQFNHSHTWKMHTFKHNEKIFKTKYLLSVWWTHWTTTIRQFLKDYDTRHQRT